MNYSKLVHAVVAIEFDPTKLTTCCGWKVFGKRKKHVRRRLHWSVSLRDITCRVCQRRFVLPPTEEEVHEATKGLIVALGRK